MIGEIDCYRLKWKNNIKRIKKGGESKKKINHIFLINEDFC